MTRKLYYEDCHLDRFTARVTGCAEGENGWRVTLDATAFYPEGGGQACDTGTLGGVNVRDVQEEGEDVIHLCDGPLPIGSEVSGQIDFASRFDQMQQHTGEHIVSGIIHDMFGWHNTGFHMGKGIMEVDFDGPIPAEALQEIERKANEAVWQNIPLKCWIPAPEELPTVFYRTKKDLPWPVRIVQVPGFDSCACCGIHVANTGEVGLIKILSATKFHQGTRLEMVCGRRAYDYLCGIFDQNRAVSQAFSAQPMQTGDAAAKMNESLAALKFRCAGLEKQLYEAIAERYVNQNNVLVIDNGIPSPRELADRIAQRCTGYAAVFSGNDTNGYSFCIISRDTDLRPLGKALTAALNGRGGGKPECQQGSVKATRAEIEAFFAEG